jgi:lia operon protein LiaG
MKNVMGLVLLAALAAGSVRAENVDRRFTLAGEKLLLVNLAGEIRVEAATGAGFEVEIAVRGRDATADLIRFDQADGPEAHLFVQYPLKDERTFIYPALGSANSSFGAPRGAGWGDSGSGNDSFFHLGDRQVRIRSHGRGLEAWADVTVRVPTGKKLEIRHGAGKISATNVQADLVLDSCVGPVEVAGVRGQVSVDTGSGEVGAREIEGDLAVDTGSGSVTLANCGGKRISVDTGSGSVDAKGIGADDLQIDTGSGSVTVALTRMGQGSFVIDTGSGSIDLQVPPDASADIRADTGSGGIVLDLAQGRVRRHERDEVAVTLGQGDARVTLDAGSGSIHIRQ